MPAVALAERFQTLGFRVIEGGKSGKLVVLNTPAVGEIFDMRHTDVLRTLGEQQKKINALGRRSFDDHCLPTKYKDKQNRWQDCFNLTKLGFLQIASKWDDPLRWLLVLAFDVLERDDADAADQIIADINNRIRELRSRSSGHAELDLPLPELPRARVEVPAAEPTQSDYADPTPHYVDLPPATKSIQDVLCGRGGIGRSWTNRWAPDVALEPEPENRFIGERSPAAFWGEPLTKGRTHHFIDGNGQGWIGRRYLKDGKLAEYAIRFEPMRSTNMREAFVNDGTKQFLLRLQRAATPLLAMQVLALECELSESERAAIIEFLRSEQWMSG
jgi:phage regulator Rha-like protein